jgi:hypothetical protein
VLNVSINDGLFFLYYLNQPQKINTVLNLVIRQL